MEFRRVDFIFEKSEAHESQLTNAKAIQCIPLYSTKYTIITCDLRVRELGPCAETLGYDCFTIEQ